MESYFEKLIKIWYESGYNRLIQELSLIESQFTKDLLDILEEIEPILYSHPEQLGPQIYARARDPIDNKIRDFAQLLVSKESRAWLKARSPLPLSSNELVRNYYEHYNFVGSIVCLPSNQFISSSEDSRMIIWDLNKEEYIRILTEHNAPINFMCLTPDKKHLISASDDYTIKVWNINNWNVLQTLEGHTDYVSKVFATEKLIVSISRDQTVRVWDFESGRCLHVLEGHNSWVYCLAVSPDGKKAITASINSSMIIWDLESGKRIATLVDGGGDVHHFEDLPENLYIGGKNPTNVGHKESPAYAIWLDDGRIISAAKDIIIWDDNSFNEIKRLEGHPWDIHYLCLFNNNRFLVSVAYSIKIWDLNTGEELISIQGHDGNEIYSAAITEDEKYLISGDKRGTIKLWNLNNLVSSTRTTGHMSYASNFQISPDGRLGASGGYDKNAIIWDLNTGKPLYYLRDHSQLGVEVLGFRYGGKELITSSSGQVRIWNTEDGNLIKEIEYPNNLYAINVWTFLENENKIFSGTMSYKPALWDLENNSTETFDIDYGFTSSLVVSKDNRSILTCTYPTNLLDDGYKDEEVSNRSPVILWDLDKNKIKREFWQPEKLIKEDIDSKKKYYPIKAIFNRNEAQVIGSFSDGTICVWKKKSGKLINSIKASDNYITELFLIYNRNLATIAQKEQKIKMWHHKKLNLIREISIPGSQLRHLSRSADRKRLAIANDKKTASIIDIESGSIIASISLDHEIYDMKLKENDLFISTKDGFLLSFKLIEF